MADLFTTDEVPPKTADGTVSERVTSDAPLADRLRPAGLADIIGQEHLTGPRRRDRTNGRGGQIIVDDPVGATGHWQD